MRSAAKGLVRPVKNRPSLLDLFPLRVAELGQSVGRAMGAGLGLRFRGWLVGGWSERVEGGREQRRWQGGGGFRQAG